MDISVVNNYFTGRTKNPDARTVRRITDAIRNEESTLGSTFTQSDESRPVAGGLRTLVLPLPAGALVGAVAAVMVVKDRREDREADRAFELVLVRLACEDAVQDQFSNAEVVTVRLSDERRRDDGAWSMVASTPDARYERERLWACTATPWNGIYAAEVESLG
jgi:hypothetical protein